MAKKILAICAALVAFAAVPAVAAASPELQDHTGAKVATGTGITAVNEGNITFTSLGGLSVITCSKVHMAGKLAENTGTTIGGSIESASFKGTGHAEYCPTNFGGLVAQVTTENLPWCLHSAKLGSWTIRGGACGAASKNLRFTLHLYNSSTELRASCTYERATVTGTNNTSSTPLILTIGAEQTFSRVASAGVEPGLCFSTGTLGGKFKVTTSTGTNVQVK
jgi:hypothetical protein